jgi:hypothetical protein
LRRCDVSVLAPEDDKPVLPDTTSDEQAEGWGERPDSERDADDVERFLRERPPHHGD